MIVAAVQEVVVVVEQIVDVGVFCDNGWIIGVITAGAVITILIITISSFNGTVPNEHYRITRLVIRVISFRDQEAKVLSEGSVVMFEISVDIR